MPALRSGLSPLLTDSVCEKLRCGKVTTVMDFIQADFQYLNKCAQLNYKEFLAIRKILLAQYAIYPTAGAEILNDMLACRAIYSTGCQRLDELLCGGIYTGELTEIIGPIAAGKTQFCFTILIQVALMNKQSVFYIDTQSGITNCRIKEIALRNGVPENAMYDFQSSKVRCSRANNIFDLFTILEQVRADLNNRNNQFYINLRLLIIDSVHPILASLIAGCQSDANGLMSQLAHLLKILSTDFFLAVI
uniref:RecA family profile 1 domain-containing protein n=1 Tax=Strigamia maritima TaxID=126957 RepID=T1JHA9_STRMM